VSRPILWSEGGPLAVDELRSRARAVASRLPAGLAIVNLCERRALFITAFCAALIRRNTTYLPASRAAGVVRDLLDSYPGVVCVNDEDVQRALSCEEGYAALVEHPNEVLAPADLVAALAFTSGTTGSPQPHRKIWRALLTSNAFNAAAIRAALPTQQRDQMPWIVATVPPQHMYGFETSVLLPLLGEMGIHAGRPLFPADVAAALAEIPEPRVLVTTPVHLRALLESTQKFPSVAVVVSATAPLDTALAAAVETQLGTRVLEMFGATETCVIATRETVRERSWAPYAGVVFERGEEQTVVHAPWFEAPIPLQDRLEVQDDGRFLIRGRHVDMIEVAGKRASLAELTQRLSALAGVVDATVFQLDAPEGGGVRRVAALVVAPGRRAQDLYAALAERVDRAFLPRPLLIVDRLPRNALGKLPRAKLLEALRNSL
jgi:acyl-coenzyme A synthetase/AMP-(fatty) acid ligase